MEKDQAIKRITHTMSKFVGLVGKKLPDDVEEKLEKLRKEEDSPLAKTVYDSMALNQELAERLDRPCCQDTGV